MCGWCVGGVWVRELGGWWVGEGTGRVVGG